MQYLRIVACASTIAAAAHPASAQETRYIDDRSSAASIVQSFYNAINRKEYARAWDYFGEDKPAKDFESFVKGYENTTQVNVITGAAASEGAAGSTYYSLPVAIISFAADGSDQVFAGCYTARLANPQIQETPFAPLHIEKGTLARSELSYDEALPASCPGAPPAEPQDAVLAQAQQAFAVTHTDCDRHLPGADPARSEVQAYSIPYRYKSESDTDPERVARLFRFYCSTGAYNETHVYYVHDELEGLRELHFATPELDISYVNGDSDGKVENIAVIGYQAVGQLVNSSFDEATKTISSHALWRGVGDASSNGSWIFRDGAFTLVHYEVDASYDGEQNPETIVDYATPP